MSRSTRQAGVLLHPTSLPGSSGIGEIGPAARQFVEWLAASGHAIWQLLPIHPADQHGCMYASSSAHAGDPLMVSLDDLLRDGWLKPSERPYAQPTTRVDFRAVAARKAIALALAADRIAADVDLDAFAAAHSWAEPFALYDALAQAHGPDWTRWPTAVRDREDHALEVARDVHGRAIRRALALQWAFEGQWAALREHARAHGVALWGDLPYFVGHFSADVWHDPAGWRLDAEGMPTVVSGVPPDAFSPTGQLWGHPLYDDAVRAERGHRGWRDRMDTALRRHDVVRIDHFRGVSAVWEIPAGAADASGGRWVDGPGKALLAALAEDHPTLPLIAEDLGVITPDVEALRDGFDLPGMAILQFAFPSDDHIYQPHRHQRRLVVFTGTHDNDTLRGWQQHASGASVDRARRYLASNDASLPWAMCRAAWQSVAETAIVPMQDLLGLGPDARMNVPGVQEGNWAWRMGAGAMSVALAGRLREQLVLAGRA